MRTAEELKQIITQVKDNNYNVPDGVCVDSIISDMLKFIGHTDGELRDNLIYSTFVQWCEEKKLVSPDKMKEILDICLSDTHLFFGIGKNGTDSVFTRSFSSLVIALAFCVHDETPFLTIADVQTIKDTVLRYISQEKDYRGYVNGKGWAHAVAHIADVLVNIAGCEIDDKFCIGRDGMLEILQAVKTLVCNSEYVYTAEEDERLVTPFMVATDIKVFTTKELIDWIDSFNMSDNEYWKGTMPGDYYRHINRKHFMRSLYFRLQSQISTEGFEEICNHMRRFLVDSEV